MHRFFSTFELEPNDLWLTPWSSVHNVDIAFHRVFSVRIPALDQIIPRNPTLNSEYYSSRPLRGSELSQPTVSPYSQRWSQDSHSGPWGADPGRLSLRGVFDRLGGGGWGVEDHKPHSSLSWGNEGPSGVSTLSHSLSHHAEVLTGQIWLLPRDRFCQQQESAHKAKHVSELVLDGWSKPSAGNTCFRVILHALRAKFEKTSSWIKTESISDICIAQLFMQMKWSMKKTWWMWRIHSF